MPHRFLPHTINYPVGVLLLIVALALWTVLSTGATDTDPSRYLASLGVLAGAYVVGRLIAPWAWFASVVAAASFLGWVLTDETALVGGPLAGPLGYANANGALAVQVAALLLVAAARLRPMAARLTLTLASLPVLAVAWANDSLAAVAGGALVLLVGLVVTITRPRRGQVVAAVVAGLLVAAAALGQLLVALGAGSDVVSRSAVTERRVDLWSDAVDLATTAPLFGHGAGTFANLSPTALSDQDAFAAHSALLEVAAEIGLVGAALVVLVVAWAYWVLSRAEAGPALVGIAGWTAFCLHALVDYVADFRWVVAAAGLALGLATGQARAREAQKSSMSPSERDQPASSGG